MNAEPSAVAVINFCNTSCGPCVAEMPALQKFHERFRADPGVVVLTISNDPFADEVREWMEKNEYDLAVLMEDGCVNRVGIHGYPTTWFVDAAGRVSCVKRGWSGALEGESGWRMDDLRGLRRKTKRVSSYGSDTYRLPNAHVAGFTCAPAEPIQSSIVNFTPVASRFRRVRRVRNWSNRVCDRSLCVHYR
jgi:hypothetical protein